MKERREKHTFDLTVDDWRKLKHAAAGVGATAQTGNTAGLPSIATMLRLIADGELIVKRRVGRPRK